MATTAVMATPKVLTSVTSLMDAFKTSVNQAGAPAKVSTFDPIKAVLMQRAHLEKHHLLKTSEAPSKAAPTQQLHVVGVEEVSQRLQDEVLLNWKFYIDETLVTSSEGAPAPPLYASSVVSAQETMLARGFIQVKCTFLSGEPSLLPTLSSERIGYDADPEVSVERSTPAVVVLAPALPSLSIQCVDSRTMAVRIVTEYEDFVVFEGNTFSPFKDYTKEARAANAYWNRPPGNKKNQQNYTERCKIYIGVILSLHEARPDENTNTAKLLKALCENLTKDEIGRLPKKEKDGFYDRKARQLYNDRMLH
jgi:hypothetical protein